MIRHFLKSPPFVALFLVALVAIQARGMLGQFREGFRPFSKPPGRVAFSWDMFAIRIERCDIDWDPPLPIGKGIHHLDDLRKPFEWEPVANYMRHYEQAARSYCRVAEPSTKIKLRCVVPSGRYVERETSCPDTKASRP